MDGEQERPKNQTVIADGQKEGVRTALANKLHFFFRSKAVCCDLRSEVLHLAVELDTKEHTTFFSISFKNSKITNWCIGEKVVGAYEASLRANGEKRSLPIRELEWGETP